MSARPTRILIIDDDPFVREVLMAYLEDCGFEVIQAGDGQTGIDMMHCESPDLVLCDLRMPGMDGLTVIATAIHDFPELPILVVSGMGGLTDAIQALKLGAWDYVTKPIQDMAILERAIAHALERARLRQENREHREHLEVENEQLRRTLLQLESMVLLNKKNQPSSRLNTAIAEIVGGVCHDLGNQINAAKLALEMRNANISIASILSSIENYVNDLHNFVQQYYKKDSSDSEEVNISNIKSMIKEILIPILHNSKIKLIINISQLTKGFRFEKILLRNILIPLIDNAYDAIISKQEMGRINIKIGSTFPEKDVEIIVCDDGIGWGEQPQFIEIKIRSGEYYSTKGPKRGEGLKNVYRIIKRLGGNLKLGENSCSGACIKIVLPHEVTNAKNQEN